jgi:hypothetical protein
MKEMEQSQIQTVGFAPLSYVIKPMLSLPKEIAEVLGAFQILFAQQRSWQKAQEMLIGVILCQGQRTVSRVLQVMGLGQEQHYGNYYRGVALVARLPWKANLYDFAPTMPPHYPGRRRTKGTRLPSMQQQFDQLRFESGAFHRLKWYGGTHAFLRGARGDL